MELNAQKVKGKTKYFCVGRNKTGTTSVKRAFEDLGYIVGMQDIAELLFDKYFFDGKYKQIINYCKSAEVFQDVPFSHAELLPHLEAAYPDSKFILTVRDDAEQWYTSITKYHAKLHGKNGRIPTYQDIINDDYRKKGFLKRLTIDAHGTSPENPYDKDIMIEHYNKHNQAVIDYFANKPDKLLVINLSNSSAYQQFLDFIGEQDLEKDHFPWENKT